MVHASKATELLDNMHSRNLRANHTVMQFLRLPFDEYRVSVKKNFHFVM